MQNGNGVLPKLRPAPRILDHPAPSTNTSMSRTNSGGGGGGRASMDEGKGEETTLSIMAGGRTLSGVKYKVLLVRVRVMCVCWRGLYIGILDPMQWGVNANPPYLSFHFLSHRTRPTTRHSSSSPRGPGK